MTMHVTLENDEVVEFVEYDDLFLFRVTESTANWLDLEHFAYLSIMTPEVGQQLRLTVFANNRPDGLLIDRASRDAAVSPYPVRSIKLITV